MPRLPTSLLLRAHAIDPLLPLLLRTCRDLPSARNELRWLREHAQITCLEASSTKNPRSLQCRAKLHHMCIERARGRPLQYILGTQPFGPLEILCKPGVLIPRPETEALTTHLSHLLLTTPHHLPTPLRILDLCTGTGCIPLLLSSLLHPHLHPHIPSLRIHGIDISLPAITLSLKNLYHNTLHNHLPPSASTQISFATGDVLNADVDGQWDILISNPPYISPEGFERDTARSVRNWEPRVALVPPLVVAANGGGLGGGLQGGDVFYPRLLEIAEGVGARVMLVEVADMAQAVRVAGMMEGKGGWEGCEIWRDWVDEGRENEDEDEVVGVNGKEVRVRGEGNGRAVLCWRGAGGRWIGRDGA